MISEYRKGLIAFDVECFVNSYFKGDINYMHTIACGMEPINTLGELLRGVKDKFGDMGPEVGGEDWVSFAIKLIDKNTGGRWC